MSTATDRTTTATAFQPGQKVRLHLPDNPVAHGQPARVVTVVGGAYHLRTTFGSGAFRALAGELRPDGVFPSGDRAATGKASGYSGDACHNCQGVRLVRSGTCSTCQDCGTTTGCS